jgi:His/Glu/Gln/Arg/opine family amino acid ABC transporter permease subunit
MHEAGIGFYVGQMLHGLLWTLAIGGLSTVVALVAGAVFAVARMRGPTLVRVVVVAYIEIIRGIPPIVQLFILFFGLTQFGIYLTPEFAGVLWLSVYGTAYAVEIFRAGIEGVPPGQDEAAKALSLGPARTFVSVILPQAVANMLPVLTSFLVIQLKTTTILYIIGVPEVIFQARLGANTTGRPLPIYCIAALIFIVVNVAISRGMGLVNRRTAWRR